MELSPPKRVTRSRATKSADEPAETARPTKVTATSASEAKTSGLAKEVKGVVKTASTAKYKSKRDRMAQAEVAITMAMPAEEPQPEPTKSRTRTRKAVEDPMPAASITEAPKRRGRPPKNQKPAPERLVGEPESKARAEKAEPTEVQVELAPKSIEPGAETDVPPKKMPRARIVTAGTRATAATVTTSAKTASTRKKVTFAEESHDKENVPVAAVKVKASKLATGPQAKPARKAPVTRTAVRRTVATRSSATQPLSPKKVTQVAKSNASSSEDELNEKSPVRLLGKSPIKPSSYIRKETPLSPQKVKDDKLQSEEGTTVIDEAKLFCKSPVKPSASLLRDFSLSPRKSRKDEPQNEENTTLISEARLLASPARRPPSSPHKDIFNESPKRANILYTMPKLSQESSNDFNIKASLLQSPARRPMISSFKGAKTTTPAKKSILFPMMDAATGTKEISTFKMPRLNPQRLFASPMHPIQRRQHSPPSETERVAEEVEELTVRDISQEAEVEEPPDVSDTPPPRSSTGMEIIVESVNTPKNVVPSRTTTPPGEPSAQSVRMAAAFDTSGFRSPAGDEESEDELGTSQDSASKLAPKSPLAKKTPTASLAATRGEPASRPSASFAMTPLCHQMSAWHAAGPERSIDSPDACPDRISAPGISSTSVSPAKPSFFEDAMPVRVDEIDIVNSSPTSTILFNDVQMMNAPDDQQEQGSLQPALEFEEYGDENAAPLDPQLLQLQQGDANNATVPTGMSVDTAQTKTITPARTIRLPREIHTVSKVPIRAADDGSPTKVVRRKTHSIGGLLDKRTALQPLEKEPSGLRSLSLASHNSAIEQEAQGISPNTPFKVPLGNIKLSKTPVSDNTLLDLATPFRLERKGSNSEILRGAAIYVDVYTTEGADASGIFVELLTQMGARCVKQWNWNSRASIGPHASDSINNSINNSSGKSGITHVVFKDGGKRTLEKVREAGDLVACVGVGWVLE